MAGESLMTEFDVTRFGALGNGVAEDTQSIQRAIDAARGGGIVRFPPGTYRTGALVGRRNVTLRGSGIDVSVLKATGQSPMLTLDAEQVALSNGEVCDLTLEGDGCAAQGLSLRQVARFSLSRVCIQNFTTCGVDVSGALVFQATRCQILNSCVGVEARASQSADPNLVAFRDCVVTSNRQYAVRWRGGSMLLLDGCDLEDNGTRGNDDSGTVRVADLCSVGEGIGVVLDRCWFEANHGHSAIRIEPPRFPGALHVVENCQIFGGDRTYGIHVDGSRPTRYFLQNVVAQNAERADLYEGPDALGFLLHSFVTCAWMRGVSTQWPVATTDDEISVRARSGISFWSADRGREPSVRIDAAGTADDTRLMLYDVSAGTLKRVSRGPRDSGGKGFRALRIPN
jgi:hypothetical protein